MRNGGDSNSATPIRVNPTAGCDLVLMAYEFSHKEHGLSSSDVAETSFQDWLERFERGVARPGGSLTHSTGTLMREMVLRGPSEYDCLLIYENLAIDYLGAAKDRWGELMSTIPSRISGTSIPSTFSTSRGAMRGSGRRRPRFSSFS